MNDFYGSMTFSGICPSVPRKVGLLIVIAGFETIVCLSLQFLWTTEFSHLTCGIFLGFTHHLIFMFIFGSEIMFWNISAIVISAVLLMIIPAAAGTLTYMNYIGLVFSCWIPFFMVNCWLIQACITKCKSNLTRNSTITESEIRQNTSLQSISSLVTTMFRMTKKELPPPSYEQAIENMKQTNHELTIFPPNVNEERTVENVLFPPPAYETVVTM